MSTLSLNNLKYLLLEPLPEVVKYSGTATIMSTTSMACPETTSFGSASIPGPRLSLSVLEGLLTVAK